MKVQQTVKDETKRLAAGVVILAVAMIGVYLILGRLTGAVALGAAWGCAIAVLNFFLMALTVQRAAEKMNGVRLPSYEEKDAAEEERDPDAKEPSPAVETPEIMQAKREMQTSYTLRMLMVAVLAAIGVALPFMDAVAVLIPLLFPRIVVMVISFVQTHRKGA